MRTFRASSPTAIAQLTMRKFVFRLLSANENDQSKKKNERNPLFNWSTDFVPDLLLRYSALCALSLDPLSS